VGMTGTDCAEEDDSGDCSGEEDEGGALEGVPESISWSEPTTQLQQLIATKLRTGSPNPGPLQPHLEIPSENTSRWQHWHSHFVPFQRLYQIASFEMSLLHRCRGSFSNVLELISRRKC
jgi:hypothetical protein